MLLIHVEAKGGWLHSQWSLTYRTGWTEICKAVHAVYPFYTHPEVLSGNIPAAIREPDDILKLEEDRSLTIRGISTILKVPLVITFVNQTNAVRVQVAQATDEFREADYQKFNTSLCQYMDSIELAMQR